MATRKAPARRTETLEQRRQRELSIFQVILHDLVISLEQNTKEMISEVPVVRRPKLPMIDEVGWYCWNRTRKPDLEVLGLLKFAFDGCGVDLSRLGVLVRNMPVSTEKSSFDGRVMPWPGASDFDGLYDKIKARKDSILQIKEEFTVESDLAWLMILNIPPGSWFPIDNLEYVTTELPYDMVLEGTPFIDKVDPEGNDIVSLEIDAFPYGGRGSIFTVTHNWHEYIVKVAAHEVSHVIDLEHGLGFYVNREERETRAEHYAYARLQEYRALSPDLAKS